MPNTESLIRDAVIEALAKNDMKGLRFFAQRIQQVELGRDLDTSAQVMFIKFKDGGEYRVEVRSGWTDEGQVSLRVGKKEQRDERG